MNREGTQIDKSTIRFERLLPGPIERVWGYLTDGKRRAEWFAGGVTELRPGGKVEFHFDHRKLTTADDEKPQKKHEQHAGEMRFAGKVLKAEPPRLLVWQWDTSEVTFELAPKGDKVLLTLTETKLPKRENVIGNSAGWHAHLDYLEAVLGGRKPPRFWASINKYEADYEKRFSA